MINSKIIDYVKGLIDELKLTDYVGILVYGSYVGGRNNKLSDLDVMIIKDNYETQDCGSLLINDVRVEYFIQDLKRLYKLVKKEIANNDPSHLTKFATCEILYDTDGRVEEFINFVKTLYSTKIETSFNDNDKFSIFSINNRIEDLETLIDKDSFYAVYYITLEKIRNLYAKIYGIIDLPIMKIERIYSDNDYARKYIACLSHDLPSQEFISLYLKCIKIYDRNVMLNNIKCLYSYSFENLDFNPKKFCLRFRERTPFKV